MDSNLSDKVGFIDDRLRWSIVLQEKLINNSLLSELDLYLLVKILKIDVFIPFSGVYRVNEIPDSFFQYPGSTYVIINLDTEGMGTHWTVLMKDENNYYYNDSFGMGLPDILLDKIKEKDGGGTLFRQNQNVLQSRTLFWSNIQRQPIDSNRCGWFCLLFVIHMMMISYSEDILLEETYKILDRSWLIESSEDTIEEELIENFLEYLELSCKFPE